MPADTLWIGIRKLQLPDACTKGPAVQFAVRRRSSRPTAALWAPPCSFPWWDKLFCILLAVQPPGDQVRTYQMWATFFQSIIPDLLWLVDHCLIWRINGGLVEHLNFKVPRLVSSPVSACCKFRSFPEGKKPRPAPAEAIGRSSNFIDIDIETWQTARLSLVH